MMTSWPSNTASMTPFGPSIAVEAGTSHLSSVMASAACHILEKGGQGMEQGIIPESELVQGTEDQGPRIEEGSESPVYFYVSEG